MKVIRPSEPRLIRRVQVISELSDAKSQLAHLFVSCMNGRLRRYLDQISYF